MHELALCASIARIVTRQAAGREVETIRLRIGQLRQVVPDTLAYCWGLVVDTTELDGSRLEIEHVVPVLRCTGCGAPGDAFTCGRCGGPAEVVAGEEFLVTSIDVRPAEAVR